MMAKTKTVSRIQSEKRRIIKNAALEVFANYGLRGATLDKIAEVSGITKPNILYYYSGKDEIYADLLNGLLDEWIAPLHNISPDGDPLEEILRYIRKKLEISKEKPLESKLFATEILHGAPLTRNVLSTSLKRVLDEKVEVINAWIEAGKLTKVNGYHLFFSIWSMTQHYADFDVQVKSILSDNDDEVFASAEIFLTALYTRALTPR
jgi:TetR/AcrR family transcriptional regulator